MKAVAALLWLVAAAAVAQTQPNLNPTSGSQVSGEEPGEVASLPRAMMATWSVSFSIAVGIFQNHDAVTFRKA